MKKYFSLLILLLCLFITGGCESAANKNYIQSIKQFELDPPLLCADNIQRLVRNFFVLTGGGIRIDEQDIKWKVAKEDGERILIQTEYNKSKFFIYTTYSDNIITVDFQKSYIENQNGIRYPVAPILVIDNIYIEKVLDY